MSNIDRREALKRMGIPAGLLAVGVSPLDVARAATRSAPLKVLVVGGHPDDPESGCGGTIARYSDAGHDVAVLYLTRGEAGIANTSHDDAARIRTAEANKASAILHARPLFFGQIDGDTHVDRLAYSALRDIYMKEQPDVVFTHWPVDTHPDHRAASLLTYDAWLRSGRTAALAYFEVLTGEQTQVFRPTDYVDITAVADRKRAACFVHASQKPDEWYPVHERMGRFRGMEHGCDAAEAFVRHDQGPAIPLP